MDDRVSPPTEFLMSQRPRVNDSTAEPTGFRWEDLEPLKLFGCANDFKEAMAAIKQAAALEKQAGKTGPLEIRAKRSLTTDSIR